MDKYIVALLNNNLRVIIPDFGAFIVKQKKPKIVVFNEDLKNDDGLLIGFMMKAEGVEKEIAMQQLSDFLYNAVKVIETRNIFSIKGLGSLRKDYNGRILFTAENEVGKPDLSGSLNEDPIILLDEEPFRSKSRTKSTPQSVSKDSRKVTSPEAKEVEPKAPKSKATKAAPEVPKSITVTTAKEIPAPEKTVITPVIIEPSQVTTIPEVQSTLNTKTSGEAMPTPDRQSAEITNNNAGYSSSKIIKWLIVILLANTLIIAFFVFQDNIRNLFKPKKQSFFISDSLFNQLSDSVRVAASDTTLVFRDIPNAVVIDKENLEEGNLRYYIVAGCFRDEVNADELVKSLKEMGFDAEKFGQIGNLYAVSFVSFDDKERAVKELKRIREEIHPEAWMTRF